jgi:hypothetical protein
VTLHHRVSRSCFITAVFQPNAVLQHSAVFQHNAVSASSSTADVSLYFCKPAPIHLVSDMWHWFSVYQIKCQSNLPHVSFCCNHTLPALKASFLSVPLPVHHKAQNAVTNNRPFLLWFLPSSRPCRSQQQLIRRRHNFINLTTDDVYPHSTQAAHNATYQQQNTMCADRHSQPNVSRTSCCVPLTPVLNSYSFHNNGWLCQLY